MRMGSHAWIAYVNVLQAATVNERTSERVYVKLDGNIYGYFTHARC